MKKLAAMCSVFLSLCAFAQDSSMERVKKIDYRFAFVDKTLNIQNDLYTKDYYTFLNEAYPVLRSRTNVLSLCAPRIDDLEKSLGANYTKKIKGDYLAGAIILHFDQLYFVALSGIYATQDNQSNDYIFVKRSGDNELHYNEFMPATSLEGYDFGLSLGVDTLKIRIVNDNENSSVLNAFNNVDRIQRRIKKGDIRFYCKNMDGAVEAFDSIIKTRRVIKK